MGHIVDSSPVSTNPTQWRSDETPRGWRWRSQQAENHDSHSTHQIKTEWMSGHLQLQLGLAYTANYSVTSTHDQ